MRKKSSKVVQLVLISSVLAACNKPVEQNTAKQKVYMRADSTAQYTEVTEHYNRPHSGGMGSALLWYMAFRHLGGGMGYANSNLNQKSVVGTNTAKANAYQKSTRGGFGKTASTNSSVRSSGS